MYNSQLDDLTDYPFRRLNELLGGAAGSDAIIMSIGEPKNNPPAFVAEILAAQAAGWGRYPPTNGTADFRLAVAEWLKSRFSLPEGMIDPDHHILPLSGTREGLYLIAQTVCRPGDAVLMPNPFYQAYYGGTVMAGATPILLPLAAENGFLPDLSALSAGELDRVRLVYLCNPSNPQGAVMGIEDLIAAVRLARRHGFILAVDECYSEIYDHAPPAGILEACARLGGGMDNVLVFHSLSKRSSAPGLRSGFVCGDARVMAMFARLRAYGGAGMPLPILAAATALWRDEEHVRHNRALYRRKLDRAERHLGGRFGFYRPAGGFFLWLAVGDGEAATKRLWDEAKIRVLPGSYLARPEANGQNPGAPYIRVALVEEDAVLDRALPLMADILSAMG